MICSATIDASRLAIERRAYDTRHERQTEDEHGREEEEEEEVVPANL